MLEVLLTVIPSLCWMIFRCFQLLSAPSDRLARQLNIQIPHTPVVSVHEIAGHDISIHWQMASQPDENIFFVVLVNGQDAGTLAHTCVRLSNLHRNTVYKIQILAVNVINNFRSESAPIYVRIAAPEADLPVVSRKNPGSDRAAIELSSSDVQTITSEPKLLSVLSAFQDEIAHTIHETAALRRRQHDEETGLKHEYITCKKELEESHDFRTKKGSDLKGLEKNKDALAFRKLKLSKVLRNYELRRNIHARKISELQVKLTKSKEKAQHLRHVAVSERSRIQQALTAGHGELASLKGQISDLDLLISAAVREKADTEKLLSKLQPLVNHFVKASLPNTSDTPEASGSAESLSSSEVWAADGQLTGLGAQVASQILELQPDWAQQFNQDLHTLLTQEDSWNRCFSAHLSNYTAALNSLQAVKCASDPSYMPRALSEYNASVEFGYSNGLVEAKKSSPSPDFVSDSDLQSAYKFGNDDQHSAMDALSEESMSMKKSMDMQEMNMQEMKMQEMKMQEMKMQEMKMQEMKMQEMKMQEMKMQEMKMQEMKMQQMNLQQMNSQQMNLQQINSQQINSQQINSQQINLQQINLQQSMSNSVNMHHMNIQNSISSPELLADSNQIQNDSAIRARNQEFDHDPYSARFPGTPARLEDPGLYGRGCMGSYVEYAAPIPSHMYTGTDTFSCARSIYSDPYLASPVSEPATSYSGAIPVQNNIQTSVWGPNVQASYMDSRSPYSGLSLSPPLNVDPINVPLPPNGNVSLPPNGNVSFPPNGNVSLPPNGNVSLPPNGNVSLTPNGNVSLTPNGNVSLTPNGNVVESGLFSNLMLSSSHNSIWSNKPSSIKLGHSQSVSSGSPIWRDVGKSNYSPTSGFTPEFLPFATEGKDQGGVRGRGVRGSSEQEN